MIISSIRWARSRCSSQSPFGRWAPNFRKKSSWPAMASTHSAGSTLSSRRHDVVDRSQSLRDRSRRGSARRRWRSRRPCPDLRTLENPLQHAQVVAEAGPEELAAFVGAEPVHAEDPRRLRQRRADVEPVREVVAHVVAAERQHRHGIAPQHADLAGGRRRRLRRQRRAEERAVLPVARFVDERHAPLPPRAEEHGVDRHAVRVVELRRERRALRRRRREAAVRMRGLLRRRRRPRPSLPVERLGRRRIVVPFPPRRAVGPQRHVRVDRVALDHVEGVRVRLAARAGHDAEESGFRIHRPQPSVRAGPQPGDVVADGPSPSSRASTPAARASPGWSCRTPTGTRR